MKELPNLTHTETRPVLKAILSRRDIRQFSSKPVAKEDLEDILYAAIWAPNHKMTEPYKFVVITQNKISEFVHVLAEGLVAEATSDVQKLDYQKKADKILTEFLLVPAFIAVGCKKNPHPEVYFEDLLTLGCACQNMLLAAEEKGLGAHWGSGFASKTKKVREYLGFGEEDVSIGLFQVGYPEQKPQTKRSPLENFVIWK